MAKKPPLTLIKAAWDDESSGALSGAMGDDSAYIQNEVISGAATLWRCLGCGWLVTRLEGDELVFVAGSGINAKEVIKLFMNNKKTLNFKTCRIHSARLGMGRYLKGLGFAEVERVYRVVV